MIDKVEVIKRARVRRAKLYFIRDKVAREARRMLRRTRLMATGEKAPVDDVVVDEPVVTEEAAAETKSE